MLKIILILIVVLLLAVAVWFFFFQGTPAKKVSKEGPIIFFGDSLTVGVGANKGEDFPSLITKELNLTNVINAGVSGDTTSTALIRLQQDVIDKNPSLVVVLLGGNDFLQRVPAEETIKNLDEIVKKISETGSAVVLVHLKANPLKEPYKVPTIEIAEKYEAELVLNILDGIFGNSKLMADQIHPNAEGYKIMAERISPHVKKLLDK
jgi:lysophospholipase L1-like esterase